MKKIAAVLPAILVFWPVVTHGCTALCSYDHLNSIRAYIVGTLEELEKAQTPEEACARLGTLEVLSNLVSDARSRDPQVFTPVVKKTILDLAKLTRRPDGPLRVACVNYNTLGTLKALGRKALGNEVKAFVTALETWRLELEGSPKKTSSSAHGS